MTQPAATAEQRRARQSSRPSPRRLSGSDSVWRSSGRLTNEPDRGVDQREQREAEQEEDAVADEQPGVSPTSGSAGPPNRAEDRLGDLVLESQDEERRHGDRQVLGQPGRRRCPTTLPISSWRGDAALIISSMTRLLFSAATPVATHIP